MGIFFSAGGSIADGVVGAPLERLGDSATEQDGPFPHPPRTTRRRFPRDNLGVCFSKG
jgi:hypothetical protein